ncbi:MAG: YqgE/AlgH family protein [Deltaproteobacteria bacterium]|nr:YqgE/AlgH family protein [Deltaproteobacteria bacterium]
MAGTIAGFYGGKVERTVERIKENGLMDGTLAQGAGAPQEYQNSPADSAPTPEPLTDSFKAKTKAKSTPPRVLVAMPTLKDGYFDRSVILLCEYDDNGAMGFVINSPSATSINDLLSEIGINVQTHQEKKIMIGGPVQADLCWVLHSPDFQGQSTSPLGDHLALTSAQEVLTGVVGGNIPRQYMMGVGYAGWGPGQLDQEIERGAWWLAEMDPRELMELNAEDRWDYVMEKLGLNTPYASYRLA